VAVQLHATGNRNGGKKAVEFDGFLTAIGVIGLPMAQ
jgi:hypothetical protein